MDKVLVTGSNGFIGSHMCRYLREKGYRVVGLGRSDAPRTPVDDYICCDLGSSDAAACLRSNIADVRYVAHLASDMRHAPYEVEVVRNNLSGTQALLDACCEYQVESFVQLSSLPVIGRPVVVPITEDHPLCPPTVYHVTKHSQELLADYAWRTKGLRQVSLRISSPIGSGVNPSTIFPTFVRNALAGEDLIVFGKGGRVQTYVHVDDICRAIEISFLRNAAIGVYNLAGPEPISNLELAERVVNLLGSSSKIVLSGSSDDFESDRWVVSTRHLLEDTGFDAEKGVDDMIADLAKGFERPSEIR